MCPVDTECLKSGSKVFISMQDVNTGMKESKPTQPHLTTITERVRGWDFKVKRPLNYFTDHSLT